MPDDVVLDARRAMELEGSDIGEASASASARSDARRANPDSSTDASMPGWATQDAGRVHAGSMLWQFIMLLYASTKMSAKDLCILMYWVYKAGAPGDFERFAMAPGADSNVYQKRLDKHLPLQRARREYYDLPCPITTKPGSRETMHKMVVPPYDALDREMQRRPLAADQVAQIVSESAQWGAYYKSHPTVRARTTNDPPVIPFALYLDGVRYSRQIGSGRAQSLLLFTVTNLLTSKRHLIGVFHKSRMCRCGCRSGMCTLYPFLLFLKWACVAGSLGMRPDRRHDGPFAPGDYFAERAGEALLAKYLLVEIKGDLVEFTTTLGFPTVASYFTPCVFCWSTKDALHEYGNLNLEDECWPPPQDYNEACSACEIRVRLTTEGELESLFVVGGLFYDKRKRGGKGRCWQMMSPR